MSRNNQQIRNKPFEPTDNALYDKKDLNSPATVFPAVPVTTAKTYTEDGTGDGYPPRAIFCLNDGNLKVTDWNDVAIDVPVLAGWIIPIMPKTVNVANEVSFLAMG